MTLSRTTVLIARLAGATAIAGALAVFFSHPAEAGPRLKAEVRVAEAVVTVGDLFEEAGDLAARPLFRAPDPGVAGVLEARDAIAAALAAGVSGIEPTTLVTISVEREAVVVGAEALADLVRLAIARRTGARVEDLDVAFDVTPQPIALAADVVEGPGVASLSYLPSSGRFTAEIAVPGRGRVGLAGSVTETVALAVLRSGIERGEIVRASDIELVRLARRRAPRGAVAEPARLVGLAARRAQRPGDPLNAADFEQPRLVERNGLVTIFLRQKGLTLSIRGRALDDGARGDVVGVLNEQSRRVIHAVVVARGEVEVAAAPVTTVALAGDTSGGSVR